MFVEPTRKLALDFDSDLSKIKCYCRIGDDPMRYPCLVDTGAAVTAVPQRYWKRCIDRSDIAKYEEKKYGGIFGGSCWARLVPIRIEVVNYRYESFDLGICQAALCFDQDARTTAQATQRSLDRDAAVGAAKQVVKVPKELGHILLGLGGGVFKMGGLCINWSMPDVHLVDQLLAPS